MTDSDAPPTDRRASEAETFRNDHPHIADRTVFADPHEDHRTLRRAAESGGDITAPATPIDAPPSETFAPAFGEVLAGRYRLLRSLGQGGMGQVWLAEVLGSEHPVALKWLSDELASDPEIRARFRREIRASLAIRHAGVVHGLDLDRLVDGRDVLVMEYVEGRTLEDVLSERGRLLPREVAHLGVSLAAALAATHDAGFIHRDLKPSNMIVTGDGRLDAATVRLLDLGVCHDETEHKALSLTAHYGGVLGTPSYMAPEQLVGESISIRSDVFSLGVVLYRMISGSRPYPGSTFTELAEAVGSMEPAALGELVPDPKRPADLDELVHAMLAFDPANRPANAHDVTRVLADIANPERFLRRAASVAVASLSVAFAIGFVLGRL